MEEGKDERYQPAKLVPGFICLEQASDSRDTTAQVDVTAGQTKARGGIDGHAAGIDVVSAASHNNKRVGKLHSG